MNRPFWSFRSLPLNACDSIEPLLSVYADGMASHAEARRVEAHLPECENCRAALSWMQATRTVLASRPVAVPPPGLHSRIALAIAASSPAPVTLRPARVFTVQAAYAAAASVTALGAVLGYALWHTPVEVPVKHPARPVVLAAVPPPVVTPPLAVRTHSAPNTSARLLAASRAVKPAAVKHAVLARKIAPAAVAPLEHTASSVVPTHPLVVPTLIIKAPVHHAPVTEKIASAHLAPAETHSVEKRLPVPAEKTTGPKLPDTLKVAKVIKEPIRVPVDIQPTTLTPDPVVRTASAHAAVSDNPLGPVLLYVKHASHVSLAAISAPVSRTAQEATGIAQTAGSSDRVPVFGGVYSPR